MKYKNKVNRCPNSHTFSFLNLIYLVRFRKKYVEHQLDPSKKEVLFQLWNTLSPNTTKLCVGAALKHILSHQSGAARNVF